MKRLFAVALAAVLAAPAAAQDDPIVAAVKPKLKDPAKPFTMTVTAKVKPGMGGKFETAFAAAIKGTRTEAGNVTYQLNRDADHPDTYVVYERWKNLAALEAHVKAEYIQKLLAALPDLLDGQPEVKVYLVAGE
jgi:quinol monooxygenase YgiN